jgi:hypothetical protein
MPGHAVSNAIGYAQHRSRSHNAVIRVYDEAGNVIETHEHTGDYLAKYLSKERPECLFRWRLWAGFGKGWEWTKVKDVIRETLFTRIYRACKEWKSWTGRGEFFDQMDFVRQMVMLTIERGWVTGCGPGGAPYDKCADDFCLCK